jgi:hypothetical protein
MAILLHDGLCWTTRLAICHVLFHDTTRLGVGPAFFGIFLAFVDSRFEGESTLPPQAGNASRWAADIYR